MPIISFLRPVDQPTGRYRLLNDIIACLKAPDFSRCLLAIGFAKSAPLVRLAPYLQEWKNAGKSVEAIFGINHRGTSVQALRFALVAFDRTYVTYLPRRQRVTFHPKLYLFYGDQRAVFLTGSHNLTLGGTELNFEGGIRLEFDRSKADDEQLFQEALSSWTSLLPDACGATRLLDESLVNEFEAAGLLMDEDAPASRQEERDVDAEDMPGALTGWMPDFYVKPPSSVPKATLPTRKPKREVVRPRPQSKRRAEERPGEIVDAAIRTPMFETLVIEIVPHHNGEIFLSADALHQNQKFFGVPFTGWTTPKKAGNPAYPQRVPDPVVDITVYDTAGMPVTALSRRAFGLNVVAYTRRSEIRITVPPELARAIPPYSILVMSKAAESEQVDYQMDIYAPGSAMYDSYLAVCNQTLPSGGKARARRMGWL